jgi:hypothetical protein
VLGDSSIDPNLTVVPTPNSAACSQSVTMSLANPTMMAPANTTVPRQRQASCRYRAAEPIGAINPAHENRFGHGGLQ